MLRRLFLVIAIAALSPPVLAQPSATVEVRDAWVRPPPPGAPTAAAYLTIANHGRGDDRLLEVSTPSAQRVEIHEMSMDGGVMRMRAVTGGLPVRAGGGVVLGPGGMHLMLIGFRPPASRQVQLALRFLRAGVLHINAPVRAAGR